MAPSTWRRRQNCLNTLFLICMMSLKKLLRVFEQSAHQSSTCSKRDGRRPFELFYHGQFDDSRPSNNVPVTGRDLSRAIDCALSGQELPFDQKPSVGCSIKWHK
uniref:Uncharacterized protein n=1 Tax=Aegilops tauschii subsp. strangulata TaxID=200361 RepID=A0A453APU1_AEGTS